MKSSRTILSIVTVLLSFVEMCYSKDSTFDNAVNDALKPTVDSLKEASDKIEGWRKNLVQFEEFINNAEKNEDLNPRIRDEILKNRDEILSKIGEAKNSLQQKIDMMGPIGKLKKGMDVYEELKSLKEAMDKDVGGGGPLRAMAETMIRFNGKIPVPGVGDIINFYGEATKGMLAALERVSNTIDQNLNQGGIGDGTYNRNLDKSDPRFAAANNAGLNGANLVVGYPSIYYNDPNTNEGAIWVEGHNRWVKVPSTIGRDGVREAYQQALREKFEKWNRVNRFRRPFMQSEFEPPTAEELIHSITEQRNASLLAASGGGPTNLSGIGQPGGGTAPGSNPPANGSTRTAAPTIKGTLKPWLAK